MSVVQLEKGGEGNYTEPREAFTMVSRGCSAKVKVGMLASAALPGPPSDLLPPQAVGVYFYLTWAKVRTPGTALKDYGRKARQ